MLTSFIALLSYILPGVLFNEVTPCVLCFIQKNMFLILFFTCFFQYYFNDLQFFTYIFSIIGIFASLLHLAIIMEYIKIPKYCKINKLYFIELSDCVDVSQKAFFLALIAICVYLFIIFGTYKEY